MEPSRRGADSLRVLVAIDCLEVGGAQHHLLMLSSQLARGGHRFTVATAGNEPLATSFEREEIPVLTLGRRSIKHRLSPIFIWRLARLALTEKFDLIHGHLHSASVAAAVAARVSRLPLVLTHHSMNTWRPGWQCALGQWADRQAYAVVAVATNVAAAAQQRGVHPRIIRNGIPVTKLNWSATEIASARARLGVPAEAYTIGFVGRFTEDKNPVLFVEVAALVAQRCPTAHFLLIGDGPLRAAAEARGHALGIESRLSFAGFQPDAAQLHQLADVLAVTSDSEGSPLSILEAMRACNPVVATAVGDVPVEVVDGGTGFVLPPRDAAGLAHALTRLEDQGLRSRLGQAGRKRLVERFSIERMVAQTRKVYGEVIRQAAALRSKGSAPTAASLYARAGAEERPGRADR